MLILQTVPRICKFKDYPEELIAYAQEAVSDVVEIYLAQPLCTYQGIEVLPGDITMEFDGHFGILVRRNANGLLESITRNDGMPNEVFKRAKDSPGTSNDQPSD